MFKVKRFLFGLLVCCLLLKAQGDLFTKIKTISSQGNKTVEENARLKLLSDVIKTREKENIVLVADGDEWNLLSDLTTDDTIKDNVGLFTSTRLLPKDVKPGIVKDLAKVHLTDNKPAFYMIIVGEQDKPTAIRKMIATIQRNDYRAKITILFTTMGVDAVKLYERKKLYNIYVFTPYDIGFGIRYRMFDICQFCENGADVVVEINT